VVMPAFMPMFVIMVIMVMMMLMTMLVRMMRRMRMCIGRAIERNHCAALEIVNGRLGAAVASAGRAHQAASSSSMDLIFNSSPLMWIRSRLPQLHGV